LELSYIGLPPFFTALISIKSEVATQCIVPKCNSFGIIHRNDATGTTGRRWHLPVGMQDVLRRAGRCRVTLRHGVPMHHSKRVAARLEWCTGLPPVFDA
jgi:hypothetical protein